MPDILLHDCIMPKDSEELEIVIHSDGRVDWVKHNPFEYIPTETKAIPLSVQESAKLNLQERI